MNPCFLCRQKANTTQNSTEMLHRSSETPYLQRRKLLRSEGIETDLLRIFNCEIYSVRKTDSAGGAPDRRIYAHEKSVTDHLT